MRERLRLILIFYLSFAIFAGLISLISWFLAGAPLDREFWRFLPLYFIMKIVTDSLIWYYIKKYNPGRMFFYSNLGISETRLFLSAFAMDVTVFFLFITTVSLCRVVM